jgi:hypothetical protein
MVLLGLRAHLAQRILYMELLGLVGTLYFQEIHLNLSLWEMG